MPGVPPCGAAAASRLPSWQDVELHSEGDAVSIRREIEATPWPSRRLQLEQRGNTVKTTPVLSS